MSELFGFYYCKVKTKNDYLGLLPVHKNGLMLPNGEWYGTYFSEELKFAKEHGYEIKVYKGYTFNKVDNVFNEYVDDLYIKKANSKGSERLINKFLLNSLLGRFGLSILKLITGMFSMDKFTEILSTKPVNSAIPVSEQDMLVSYKNEISKKITTEHGLDYIKLLNKKSKDIENNNSFEDVAISISAAVTSYARIYMSQIKLDILKNLFQGLTWNLVILNPYFNGDWEPFSKIRLISAKELETENRNSNSIYKYKSIWAYRDEFNYNSIKYVKIIITRTSLDFKYFLNKFI